MRWSAAVLAASSVTACVGFSISAAVPYADGRPETSIGPIIAGLNTLVALSSLLLFVESLTPAPEPSPPAALSPAEILRTVLATSGRDWSQSAIDAQVYAIVLGWDDAWAELAETHSWTPEFVEQMQQAHRAFTAAFTAA